MSGVLPPGWRHGTLADVIASISTGVSVNGEDRPVREGEVGVLKITAVLRGVFEPEHHKAVMPADRHRVSCPVRGGTVLVSRSNTAELVGSSAYVHEPVPGLFLPDKLWALTAADGMNIRWLASVLANPAFRPHLAGASNGTSGSMKNIPQETFLRLPIVVPPRDDQDRIVEIVETWNRGIEVGAALLSARRRALQVARRALVEGAEADAAELSRFAVNTNRLIPVSEAARRDLPCIELENVEEATGRILGVADASQLRGTRRAFEPGDVLYGRLRPYLRKFAHARTPGVCSTEVWVLAANPRVCLPGYLYQIVQTDRFNAEANKSSGSRMPRADWDVLSRVEFPIPSVERQQRVVALLAAEEEALDLLTRLVERLGHQRAGLMERLLSGAGKTLTGGIAELKIAEALHA